MTAVRERLLRTVAGAQGASWPVWRLWALPLAVFVLTRLVDAVMIWWVAHQQPLIVHGEKTAYVVRDMPASPGYFGALTNWDGQWYERIAESSYPKYLPRDAFGHVDLNPWAFFPLFPALTRLVMLVSGLGFAYAATLVAMVCGGLAMVLLFRLVYASGGPFVAVLVIVSLCTSPAAPVFQAAYSESLALLLIVSCLWLLRRQRYGWLMPVTIALAFARPVVAALALVIAIHGFQRLRHDPTFTKRERWWVVAAAGVAGLSFFGWIAIAGIVTGQGDAYQLTQNAWAHWQWDQVTMGWASWLYELLHLEPAGFVAMGLFLWFLWLVRRAAGRAYGTELQIWAPVYVLYLLAATRSTPSIVRYCMLAAVPWWPIPNGASWPLRSRRALLVIGLTAIVGLVLQALWVRFFFLMTDAGLHGYP